MKNRRKARENAIKILYQLEMSGYSPEECIRIYWEGQDEKEEVKDYSNYIVRGVSANIKDIDEKIQSLSKNWILDRMHKVDKAILRLSAFELLFIEDVPFKVAIDEAIELAKKFGTEESKKFINGILDKFYKKFVTNKKSD
ncbi:MAG: transcription antitermination factor NusB [Proteobacteria bacterium]|nr:transcription antitermination factor NusB [Pseudomonadota bacterium]